MFNNPVAKIPFSISGTGDTVGVFRFFGKNTLSSAAGGSAVTDYSGVGSNGKLYWIMMRQAAGGDATALDYKLVDREYAVSTSTVLANIPDEYLVSEGAAVALTASATDASLNSVIDSPAIYQSSLALVIDVTTAASGAWTITGYIGVER